MTFNLWGKLKEIHYLSNHQEIAHNQYYLIVVEGLNVSRKGNMNTTQRITHHNLMLAVNNIPSQLLKGFFID